MTMPCNLDLRNMDCMELMAQFPDKHFELAIVDPPYGMPKGSKYGNGKMQTRVLSGMYEKGWDIRPCAEYFIELIRVSRNQIIWGGNCFTKDLPESRGWIYWDKKQPFPNFSSGELAWTSFNAVIKAFAYDNRQDSKQHPTQKPVALYKWLLKNYAKEGDKILDTHLGSGSIAIACWDAGFDLTGSELDTDYFAAMQKRIAQHTAQGRLAL